MDFRIPRFVNGASQMREFPLHAGFKLVYESATGFKTAGTWYTIPDNKQWHTVKWKIDDPQFVNHWGYNFKLESVWDVLQTRLIKRSVPVKNLKRGEAAELGKRLLNQALEEFSLTLRKISTETIDTVVVELGLRTEEELFEKIGLGERVAPFIARRLLPADSEGVIEGIAGPLAIAGVMGGAASEVGEQTRGGEEGLGLGGRDPAEPIPVTTTGRQRERASRRHPEQPALGVEEVEQPDGTMRAAQQAGPLGFFPNSCTWASQVAAGSVVLVGDAAGAVDPSQGMGTSLLFRDVRARKPGEDGDEARHLEALAQHRHCQHCHDQRRGEAEMVW